MITAKQVYGTYPHVQMRWYIERTKPEATKAAKAAFLGQLVGKFVANCNAQHPHREEVPADVNQAFVWENTPERSKFWHNMHAFNHDAAEFMVALVPGEFLNEWLKPVKVGRVKLVKAKLPPPAPKLKRVGWWA